MADEVDRVTAQQELLLARAIEAQRPTGSGRLECEDCDQPIPAARRMAYPAARRCVAYQSRMEARR